MDEELYYRNVPVMSPFTGYGLPRRHQGRNRGHRYCGQPTSRIAIEHSTRDKTNKNQFNTPFDKTVIKGEADRKGTKIPVTAAVWTLPENLVYLIDAGRVAPHSSQIFEAAKSLRGEALLNDAPDRKFHSGTDQWGYVEREQYEDQKVYVTAGNGDDWATSFLSDGKDKDEGLTYKLTLQLGVYRIRVAHVPVISE